MPAAGRIVRLTGCRILRRNKLSREDLWFRDGRFVDPENVFYAEQSNAHETFYCPYIIAPGFVDIQINGCAGIDFSIIPGNKMDECLAEAAHFLLRFGVTAFCPTIVTSSTERYHEILPYIKRTKGGMHGAEILGVHLEGPFINRKKRGAHDDSLIVDGFDEEFKTLLDMYGAANLDNVSIVTLAPELKHSCTVIQQLVELGIKVSLGHTESDLACGEEAVRHGASCITHLFNAMIAFHHRDPGLFGLLASTKLPVNRKVFLGLISDNVHAHPTSQRIAYRVGRKELILITDAMAAMGLGDGTWSLGTQTVTITGHEAVLAGTTTLAGSVATMDECVRNLWRSTQCPMEHALDAATLHPATFLGMQTTKGTLDYGADADFVALDDDLNVKATFIGGECVYKADDFMMRSNKFQAERTRLIFNL